MNDSLSPNTRAILLLAAPLIAGGKRQETAFLTAAQYRKFASRLHSLQAKPADLLGPEADRLVAECGEPIDRFRLKSLLGRGFLLTQALERWRTRAIWVISRADDAYPRKLKERLKNDAPVMLYGCGQPEIMHARGLAIVGSRDVSESLLDYTREVASLTARAGRTVVSGAAKGIDRAAMNGALQAGGTVAGVLAGDLERTVMNREHRNLLLEERLLLISPYDPCARFQVGHAMQRNKTIYALADAALVVNAVTNKGGTWAGAMEQLKKYSVPVYVRSTGNSCDGLDGLKARGARPWPNPDDPGGIEEVLNGTIPPSSIRAAQAELFNVEGKQKATASTTSPRPKSPIDEAPKQQAAAKIDYAEELYRKVRSWTPMIFAEPIEAATVAQELKVTMPTANGWIKRLIADGILVKRTKPVRYVARQKSLLEDFNTSYSASSPDRG